MLSELASALADRYRIEREIGAGGMATVYLAHDLKHDRKVAVKVLRPELAAAVGATRFLAEIRVTANLQHPHILPLFDSGEAVGHLFYVMPFVSGETLRQRLDKLGQLPIDEAVGIITDIASALEHAHRQGVLHRDLKPENILLHEDIPLLADFGIALALTATGDQRVTRTGLIVGTPRYMSPEQTAGERVLGAEADTYSLAAVLYEMLSGEPPFTGHSTTALIARVMLEPPRSIRTVRPSVPLAVEAAILKALAKRPSERFRSVSEFAAALKHSANSRIPASRRDIIVRTAVVSAMAAILVAGLVYAVRASRNNTTPSNAVRRQITFSGKALKSALSPGGDFLAYTVLDSAAEHVIVVDLAGGKADTVMRTGATWALDWSPDGTRLLVSGFDAERSAGFIGHVPRAGGEVQHVALARDNRAGFTGRWLPDGRRVAVRRPRPADRLVIVDAFSQDTTSVAIPGGHHVILAWDWARQRQRLAVAVEYINPMRTELLIVDEAGKSQVVHRDSVFLEWVWWDAEGDGIYFSRNHDEVWRVPVSPRTGKARGAAVRVDKFFDALPAGIEGFSLSLTGDRKVLSYTAGKRHSNLHRVEARVGGTEVAPLTVGTTEKWGVAVSPGGDWIAFSQHAGSDADIYRMPIQGGTPTRITFGADVRPNTSLAWSPDSKQIVFFTNRDGRDQLWLANVADGQLTPLRREHVGSDGNLAWAPGRAIAFTPTPQTKLLSIDPVSREEKQLGRGYGSHFSPRYSPDGKRIAVLWIALAGDTGTTGIWIFDHAGTQEPRIFPQWGYWPRGWSSDGRYVYLGRYAPGSVFFRLDTYARADVAPQPFLNTPFRAVECVPIGRNAPDAFICTAFDFVSDITLVENFDGN